MSKSFALALLRDFFTYAAGDLLVKIGMVITLPVYTRVFTPREYGVWSFVVAATMFFNAFLVLGGDSAYSRHFFEARTIEERRSLTSTWLIFLVFWGGAVAAVAMCFATQMSLWAFETTEYVWLFVLSLGNAPLALINTMCGQVLRNEFRAGPFVVLNVLTLGMTVGLGLIAVLVFDLGLLGVVGGTLVGTLLMLPMRIWTVRSMIRFTFSFAHLRAMLGYGLPLVPMSVAYWIFSSADRFMLAKLSTLQELGLYSVAATATGVLAFLNGALGQAWSPYAVHLYEEQPESAPVFFGKMLTYIITMFSILGVLVATFAPEGLLILTTFEFVSAAQAVGPLCIGFIAYATTQVTGVGISLKKKTIYFALFSWLAAGFNVALNLVAIPKWGMLGASWTTAISFVFLTFAYAVTSQRLWRINYETRRIIPLSVAAITFIVGSSFLPELSLIPSLILKLGYCLIFFAVLFPLQNWTEIRSILVRVQ